VISISSFPFSASHRSGTNPSMSCGSDFAGAGADAGGAGGVVATGAGVLAQQTRRRRSAGRARLMAWGV